MIRWASEPRDTWSLEVDGNNGFNQLLADLDSIVNVFCFYIDTVWQTSSLGEKELPRCVSTGTTLILEGKNLYDMAQDLVPLVGTEISGNDNYGYSFSSSYFFTRVIVDGTGMNGAVLEYSSDCINYDTIPGWAVRSNTRKVPSGGGSDTVYIWELIYDNPLVSFEGMCLRLSGNTGMVVSSMEIFGKGSTSEQPLCRFTSLSTGSVYYSNGQQTLSNGTEFRCDMPDTNGDYGEYIVEMNRNGGTNGAFTSNQRTIRHTTSLCRVPISWTEGGGLGTGETLSPTNAYFRPTPAPPEESLASQLEASWNLCIFFLLLSGHLFYF